MKEISKKHILHGISGEFRSGELTAIMGPSGAGKSTLLNILAGFIIKGSSGEICINGLSRTNGRLEQFLKMSCYILQDDELRPLITVREAMTFATHLKLGISVPICEKEKQITYLLDLLGLSQHEKTMTKRLSGGQKKRLSIALELITNPPVLFLDEPTTGLDSSSTSSCVSLMKNLARQGRTIICTIHQPSALIFEMMDHLYAIANGHCIYQGSVQGLLPYLGSLGLICPNYHNPADFLIEVAIGEYGSDHIMLATAAAKKGRQDTNSYLEEAKEENGISLRVLKSKKNSVDIAEYSDSLPNTPLSYQLIYLLWRNIIIQRRDASNLLLRIALHLLVSLSFGVIYYNAGKNANNVYGNYIFVYGTNLFLHYAGQMAVTLSFPLELNVLRREYFNRWYSLAPYCLATVLIEIPFQILCVLVYFIPSYLLTAQPLEWTRFSLFLMFTISVCLTAQAGGYLVGATTPVTLAVFIGPVITVFLSVFGFASKYSEIPSYLKIFYYISYFRVSFQGSLNTLYGFNRTALPCLLDGFHGETGYCHYRHAIKFLKEMDFSDLNIGFDFSFILGFGILLYACTVSAIWLRLNCR
ncbi:ATP-binding cassette sub-family G member 1-like isoform X2 [Lycorma delicatula]|uniref:ATP-binding cassette sub-family G member 1-like isoform X2 n=1 Tax=Lycorma delicatula TaxID=130591 RepID=UPI003F51AB6A